MSINKVNQKLFKSKKVDLKTRKVNLNKLNEIQEAFDIAGYNVGDFFDEVFFDGRQKIIEARDVMRFELTDFYTYQEELINITDNLDEMGIEYPDQINELLNIEELILNKINENHSEFENLGINPMFDRR